MADNERTDSEPFRRNAGNCVDPAVENFVNEFLSEQLRKSGYVWTGCVQHRDTPRSIEAEAGRALRILADEFTAQFKDQFTEMCRQLTLTADNIDPTVEGVANELFSDGIKWARIVAFFVFGCELALQCRDTNAHELISVLAHSISAYVTQKLLPWINNHGGWAGLIRFKDEGKKNRKSGWPSVGKLLLIGITTIGALTVTAFMSRS